MKHQIFLKILLKIVLCTVIYEILVKYSENFESEIRTKFTENFENILGKLRGRFFKSINKFCEKLTNFGFS